MEKTNNESGGPARARRRLRASLFGTTTAALAVAGAVTGGSLAASATSRTSTAHVLSATRPAATKPAATKAGAVTRPTAAGVITSVDTAAGTFVLKERNGTAVTVDVSSSTSYTDPGVSAPGLSSVAVGDRVAVVGTLSSGTVTATSVAIGAAGMADCAPGQMGGTAPTAAGVVQSVDAASNTFVLKELDGTTVTVDVSSSTSYTDSGVTSPGLSSVSAGERVAVVGKDTSGTVTATSVMIGMPGGGLGGPGDGPGGPGGSYAGQAA